MTQSVFTSWFSNQCCFFNSFSNQYWFFSSFQFNADFSMVFKSMLIFFIAFSATLSILCSYFLLTWPWLTCVNRLYMHLFYSLNFFVIQCLFEIFNTNICQNLKFNAHFMHLILSSGHVWKRKMENKDGALLERTA